ncbi:electron transfer flavoprotein subunit alpha/FixB family protein [Salinisphaera hydrothermalis]|uniref:Electron transfer flavoprotein subunit alpha n=1 Tax=Salinisphaera hydrothermalis (strain C41B8) TaxID=1304275 RepID=A0A084ILQ7_SALHC|nr:FAD-binding protein [Salinisphaera hydrothermalis]KEZ77641.1 electron transfer flavoprotein alpha subunit [Salinisphaera hydrothermalis C41B8]
MSYKILIIADHLQGALNESTARTIACAQQIAPDAIDVLVLADDGAAAIAAEAARIDGVATVYHADDAAHAHPTAAVLAPRIAAAVERGGYSHVLGPNTTFGKDLMPRVAALLGAPMVTDIMAVHTPHEFDRPIYAGNAVNTVAAPADRVLVASVRCASYPAAAGGNEAAIEPLELDVEVPSHTRFVGLEQQTSDRPDLQTAPKVVSGGRGVGSEENFRIIYNFADKIGAAVGASRAAVDAGYVPNDMQVGQTGKIISPTLYICFGISGAIQHLAGIKDAGTIVAINKDEDAPIFEIADIGLVGDLFDIIPELERAVG